MFFAGRGKEGFPEIACKRPRKKVPLVTFF